MKIISVVGARPNFMKIAPFIRAIEKHNRNFGDKVSDIRKEYLKALENDDKGRVPEYWFSDCF